MQSERRTKNAKCWRHSECWVFILSPMPIWIGLPKISALAPWSIWRALSTRKLSACTDFVTIFQVAWNPLNPTGCFCWNAIQSGRSVNCSAEWCIFPHNNRQTINENGTRKRFHMAHYANGIKFVRLYFISCLISENLPHAAHHVLIQVRWCMSAWIQPFALQTTFDFLSFKELKRLDSCFLQFQEMIFACDSAILFVSLQLKGDDWP